ncbi:MAG: Ger(x)C family spore germination protein [Ectobacillus sp.]
MVNRRYKYIFILFLLCSITMLSGCWNRRELNELAFVTAIGIDKTKKNTYRMSFQVVSAEMIAGEKAVAQGEKPVFRVYDATGSTLFEALRKASKEAPRRLFFGHTNLIVLGEKLARDGIQEVFDLIERDPEFRTESSVVIAKDVSANDFLKVITSFEKVPATKVIRTLRITEKVWGENMIVTVADIIKGLVSPGKEPVISAFNSIGHIKEGQRIETTHVTEPKVKLQAGGLGIVKRGKLIGWLQKDESRGLAWIQNKMKSTIIQVNWKGKKDAVAIELIRQHTTVDASVNGKNIKIHIHVKAEGDIAETKAPIQIMNVEHIFALQTLWRKEIEKEIMTAVTRAQKEKTDIFGFGEVVHRTSPKTWKTLEKRWHDVTFPKLDVDVNVQAFVRRSGIRSDPYFLNVKKE